MAPNDERSESLSPQGEGSPTKSNPKGSREGLAPASECWVLLNPKGEAIAADNSSEPVDETFYPKQDGFEWVRYVLPALPQGEVEAGMSEEVRDGLRLILRPYIYTNHGAIGAAKRWVESILTSPRSTVQGPKPSEVGAEDTAHLAQLQGIERAARALLAFGHPREGSDRYHRAWEALQAAVAAPAVQGAKPEEVGLWLEAVRADFKDLQMLHPYPDPAYSALQRIFLALKSAVDAAQAPGAVQGAPTEAGRALLPLRIQRAITAILENPEEYEGFALELAQFLEERGEDELPPGNDPLGVAQREEGGEKKEGGPLAGLGEPKTALLYELARHIRNTDAVPATKWGWDAIDILARLRDLDPENYDREVKATRRGAPEPEPKCPTSNPNPPTEGEDKQ